MGIINPHPNADTSQLLSTQEHRAVQKKTPHEKPHTEISNASLEIRRGKRLHDAGALAEPRLEDPVRVLKHAVLETDDDELRPLEARLDQAADVLRVREVERGVDLVEYVHGRRLELEQRHDEGEGDEGSRQSQTRPDRGIRIYSQAERRKEGNVSVIAHR